MSRHLFHAVAIKPKGVRELKFAAFSFHIFAVDAAQARAALDARLTFGPLHIDLYEVASDRGAIGAVVLSDSVGMWSAERLAEARGLPQRETPVRTAAPSTRKLGEVQLEVLKTLRRNGRYPVGWEWDTESGTRRVLEKLRLRCLVDFVDDVYTVNAAGAAACESARESA